MMRRMRDVGVPLAGLVLLLMATAIAEFTEFANPIPSYPSPRKNGTSTPGMIGSGVGGMPEVPQPPFVFGPGGRGGIFRGRKQPGALQAQALPAAEEPPDDNAPQKERSASTPVPSLRADPALARKLEAARDCLKEEAWVEATYLLQALLDHSEDVLVAGKRSTQNGSEITCWTGIRGEAARLIGELPPAGRQFYETRYAPRAKALLAEARQLGDINRVADVASRYAQTAAGAEANLLLAAHYLDRGRHHLAAVCFARLLARRDAATVPPAALFHAALAFHRAGDLASTRQAWERLCQLAPSGLRLGDKDLNLTLLKRELDAADTAAAVTNDPTVESYPGLEARWTLPTAHDNTTRNWLQTAITHQVRRSQPVLPAFHPLPCGDRIVYRSHRGVHALDARTGYEAWGTPFAWSMDQMASNRRFATSLETWVTAYHDYSPHVLFENSVLGTLTSDGNRVFAVDDLAVPPYRSNRPPGRWRQEPTWPEYGAGLNEATYHNRLLALDIGTGKPLWETGGYAEDPDDGELLGAYFLGPPLPIDGRLYGVMEKNNELLLVCLNAPTGDLIWKQPLAFAPTRLLLDPGRRLQAVRPVFGQGVLVCPTNAGVVVGVDVATPALLWAYPYRTQSLTQSAPTYERRGRSSPSQIIAKWKAPVTLVANDRVLFTAADESSIHCLSLRDGALRWKQRCTDDDLSVAGIFEGKALVVGKRGCRALDLASGDQLWKVATGMPTGQGTAHGHTYYLPVKEKTDEQGPTICAIDLNKGEILARTPAPAKEAPGNLFFHNGEILSQSATAVTAYTRQKEKPKEEKAKEEKNKDDSAKKGG